MDEIVGELATRAGGGSAVAEKSVGLILGFLRTEGLSDNVHALIDKFPGAEVVTASANQGGGPARLMGADLMAIGTGLMGVGDIRNIARELLRHGRDKIGADQMGKIVAGTQGPSQLA